MINQFYNPKKTSTGPRKQREVRGYQMPYDLIRGAPSIRKDNNMIKTSRQERALVFFLFAFAK